MSKTQHSPILALDFGEKRIGVAVSDPGRTIAQPMRVLKRINRDADIKAIGKIAEEKNAGLIVLGLPRKSSHELGPLGERVLSLGRRLTRVLGLPVVFVDEFETTVEAEQALIAADMSRQKRKQVVDMLAASLILRRYLEEQNENCSAEPQGKGPEGGEAA